MALKGVEARLAACGQGLFVSNDDGKAMVRPVFIKAM
eukprot:CAMPEP_0172670868 /NCGR_PEP_ID=MMETSP1074-20121228/10559_1 /TAXON_ID=2916 /ORGANISM="Ceratium fusus, Strain PA161109" /LENGTH=36 /DNA_ID= /DNA_START= /DNA_END= /DNA_ORIENTATION=